MAGPPYEETIPPKPSGPSVTDLGSAHMARYPPRYPSCKPQGYRDPESDPLLDSREAKGPPFHSQQCASPQCPRSVASISVFHIQYALAVIYMHSKTTRLP